MRSPARLCNHCQEISALPGELLCAECNARGAPRMVQFVKMVECLACKGTGEGRPPPGEADWRGAVGMPARQCRDCGGSGSVSESQARSQAVLERHERENPGTGTELVECPACDGAGCRFCGGIGQMPEAKADALGDMLT
jgi:DnaJ-class molecular chaperone